MTTHLVDVTDTNWRPAGKAGIQVDQSGGAIWSVTHGGTQYWRTRTGIGLGWAGGQPAVELSAESDARIWVDEALTVLLQD